MIIYMMVTQWRKEEAENWPMKNSKKIILDKNWTSIAISLTKWIIHNCTWLWESVSLVVCLLFVLLLFFVKSLFYHRIMIITGNNHFMINKRKLKKSKQFLITRMAKNRWPHQKKMLKTEELQLVLPKRHNRP